MRNTLKIFLLCAACFAAASCAKSRMEQMAMAEKVLFNCTPEVLALVGDKIPVEITAECPAGYFEPKAILEVTPVLVYGGTEQKGPTFFYQGEKVGYVTSATMIPYYKTEGEGAEAKLLEETGKRAIGIAFIRSDIPTNAEVEVDVRGKRLKAVIPLKHVANNVPPYVIPVIAQ